MFGENDAGAMHPLSIPHRGAQHTTGYVGLGPFVKAVPARFLHSKVIIFLFVINTHFGRGTFRSKYCVSPQTSTSNLSILQ